MNTSATTLLLAKELQDPAACQVLFPLESVQKQDFENTSFQYNRSRFCSHAFFSHMLADDIQIFLFEALAAASLQLNTQTSRQAKTLMPLPRTPLWPGCRSESPVRCASCGYRLCGSYCGNLAKSNAQKPARTCLTVTFSTASVLHTSGGLTSSALAVQHSSPQPPEFFSEAHVESRQRHDSCET